MAVLIFPKEDLIKAYVLCLLMSLDLSGWSLIGRVGIIFFALQEYCIGDVISLLHHFTRIHLAHNDDSNF